MSTVPRLPMDGLVVAHGSSGMSELMDVHTPALRRARDAFAATFEQAGSFEVALREAMRLRNAALVDCGL